MLCGGMVERKGWELYPGSFGLLFLIRGLFQRKAVATLAAVCGVMSWRNLQNKALIINEL